VRRVAVTGLLATLVAMVANTLVAALARAVALLRWSARPAERFLWIAGSLTVISLVPPLLSGGDAATVATLIGLHLVATAVMLPALARSLRR